MNGISFDIGSDTGCAIWHGETLHTTQLYELKNDYFGYALSSFEGVLRHLVKTYQPDWVAYEEVMVKNKYHAELHFGMVGQLAITCCRRNIPLLGVNTMSMKKLVTGTGRAKKEQVVAEIAKRYPKLSSDLEHNQADAVGVGLYALNRMKPPEAKKEKAA